MARGVPAGLRQSGAALGGRLWWAADAGRRRNGRANYAAVLGLPPDHPRVRLVTRRAFENYGRMLADFLLVGSLSPDELRSMVTVDGREHVDAALARGRGAILVIPHMGSWDLPASGATASPRSPSAFPAR